jgi:hypothetical protein
MLALIAAQEAVAVASDLAAGLVPAISASSLDGFAVGMLLSGGVFLLITARSQGPRRRGRAGSGPAGAGSGSAQPGSAGSGSAQPGSAGSGPAQPGSAGSGSAQPGSAGSGSAQPGSAELTAAKPAATGAAGAQPDRLASARARFGRADAQPGRLASARPARFGRAEWWRASAGRRRAGARRPDAAEPGQKVGEYLSSSPEPGSARRPDASGGEYLLWSGGREKEHGAAAQRGLSRRATGYQSRHRLSSPEDSKPWPPPDGRRRAARHAAPSSTLGRRMSSLAQVRALAGGHRAA